MSIVAIVGRPNVGKSTLFNRLVGMRKAIVNDSAGTTRDRHYGTTDWCGREFSVIDTGGYAMGGEDIFEAEIRKQQMQMGKEARLTDPGRAAARLVEAQEIGRASCRERV